MKILTKQYLLFFLIVLVVSPIIGLVLVKEEFTALFAARAIFTAALSTLIYFMFNKRMQQKK